MKRFNRLGVFLDFPAVVQRRPGEFGLELSFALAGLPDGFVELPPAGIDDWVSAGKRFGSILDKSINIIVLHHVREVVFLAPTGEHPARDGGVSELLGGRDHGRLMSGLGQPTDFGDG